MKKLIQILGAALVVQIALFAFLATREETTATFKPTEALVGVDSAKVDKVLVEEKGDKKLTLVKKDGVWLVPEQSDFPASGQKMTDFLRTMSDFKKSWPVAKTDIAAKQFNVTDEKFERKITFFQGEQKLKTLYLGTSPSFRKIHARVDGDAQTYSVNFNAFDAPVAAKEWFDKAYLHTDRTKVKELQLAKVTLHNKGGEFGLSEVPEGKELKTTKLSAITGKVLGLDFDEMIGPKDKAQFGEKALSFKIVHEDGAADEFDFFKVPVTTASTEKPADGDKDKDKAKDAKKEDDSYILTTSKHPYAFKVRKSRVDELSTLTAEELLKEKGAPEVEEKKESANFAVPGDMGANSPAHAIPALDDDESASATGDD